MEAPATFQGDFSTMWKLGLREPLWHLTWDWWWWLVMIDDPEGEEQAFHTEQIGDGQDASWTHSQYNVEGGDWNLNVTIDAGNDSIDIHHIVTIAYEVVESPPNPLATEGTEQESDSLSV